MRILGLAVLVFFLGATAALAQGTGGGNDSFDWGDLGGVGIGAAIGGVAGATATLVGSRSARKTALEERRESAQKDRRERLTTDIRALATEAAATHRELSALLEVADTAGVPEVDRQAARNRARAGIGEVGWRQQFVLDDDLRSRATKYASQASHTLNASSLEDRRTHYREASDELNGLMRRAGDLYRDLSAEESRLQKEVVEASIPT